MSANSDEDILEIRRNLEKQNDTSANVALADGRDVTQVGTVMQKWGDNFSGATLDLTKWDVITDTGGMTVTVSGGNLTVGMGVNNAARYKIRSKAMMVTNPVNLSAIMSLSQRIAGNEVRIGLVEVSYPSGALVAHSSLPNESNNRVSMLFNGTSATAASIETICESSAIVTKTASMNSMASLVEMALEVRPEDVTLTNRAADSASAKSGSPAFINSQLPAMNRVYKIELDFYNSAAPASNTNVVVSRLLVLDIQELMVEVGGGRGNAASGQGVPVNLISALTTLSVNGQGGQAHDAASQPNPMVIGGTAVNAAPTAVSAALDVTRTQHDMTGRLVAEIGGIPQAQRIYSASLGVNTETAMFSAITLGRNRLSSVWIKNKDSVTHTYTIREGLAGTVFREITLTAGAERDVLLPNDAVVNSAVNRAWTIQIDTAQTTAASLIVATSKDVNT